MNIENCQFGLELLEEELPRWEDLNVHTAALNWQLAKLKMMIATSQKQFPQHRRAALECAKNFSDSEKDTHFGVLVCAYADMLCQWCYEGDKVNADDAASEVQSFLGRIPKCFTGRALYALGTWHEKCHGRFYEAAELFKDGFQGEVSFSSKSSQREALLFLSAMVRAYEKANSLEDALYWAKQADALIKDSLSEQDPVASYALGSFGLIYAKKEEWTAASDAFQKAIRARTLVGDGHSWRSAALYVQLGKALREQGQPQEAVDQIQIARRYRETESDPRTVGRCSVELGFCYFDLSDLDLAREAAEVAQELGEARLRFEQFNAQVQTRDCTRVYV